MMNPKISIIVPIYNVEKYLNKCIDSILAQTFIDFELILVNDGSPDNCGEICNEYAKKDSRIKVIHKENGGVSSARNTGIEIAKGQYFGFIDSDDTIHEKMYEILYQNAVQYSSDIVLCDFLEVNEDENPEEKNKTEFSLLHYSNIQALYHLYTTEAGKSDMWVYPWNKLYKGWLFNDLRFKEGRIYEDEFMAHEILYSSTKVTCVNEKLYNYLQRPDSYIGSKFSKRKFDRVYALKERADFFRTIKQNYLHNLAQRHFIDVFIFYYFKAKFEISNAKKELKELKKIFYRSLVYLLRNPLIGWKQKLTLIVFFINPVIYEKLTKVGSQCTNKDFNGDEKSLKTVPNVKSDL
jgi:glycosyltransferase involved in cell wall biosynthesis